MSDLTALVWSESTVEQLRRFEDSCEDSDLFCVGYLIPLVQLLEVERESLIAGTAKWLQWFTEYVEQCLRDDKMHDDDANRIRTIILELG